MIKRAPGRRGAALVFIQTTVVCLRQVYTGDLHRKTWEKTEQEAGGVIINPIVQKNEYITRKMLQDRNAMIKCKR
jgi:hypothetical protein